MLSPDRPQHRAPESRRAGAKAAARAARRGTPKGAMGGSAWDPVDAEQAQSFDPNEPWDAVAAEALTRLCESEEGNLCRPPAGERAPRSGAQAGQRKGSARQVETAAVDRTWLEAHLSRLAKRLQRSLAQSAPEQSLAALNDRLDAIEQRFGAALGRVAQRADLDGLKSIEAEVMELAAQLVEARDRLDRIGAVDDEVRGLAQRLDEAGERRAAALEKLLRDCLAEWRAGEERTASALHNLEEAIGRLGDSVDAMEASKPAPDLTVPTLATPELEHGAVSALSGPHGASALAQTEHFYQSTLDAADYAPKPVTQRAPAAEEPAPAAPEPASLRPAAVEWSAGAIHADIGRGEGTLTARSWEIAALRARLRQAQGAAHPDPAAQAERSAPDGFRRAGLSLLLAAGAAVLASSTYLLYQAVVAPILPARPAATEPRPQAVGGGPELPGGRRG